MKNTLYSSWSRAAVGLWFHPQPYPHELPNTISFRQSRDLPPSSFGFRLTMDTLGFG